MNNGQVSLSSLRRTTSDDVFYQLHENIVNLRLLPGAKLSESDIARQFDVSRQPVREAFIRLSNMGLLTIRPQKATLVRKLSMQDILNARFIRTAVEVEVIRKACRTATELDFQRFKDNIKAQQLAARKNDSASFHALDYEFHRLICLAANAGFAFETLSENKSHVDRLCMLVLANRDSMLLLIEDHKQIFAALQQSDENRMVELTRVHLSRLDTTLQHAREEHADFFED